jgi:hypothetical protein
MAEKGRISPWLWIGCGCALAILAIVAVIAGVVFFGIRSVKGLAESVKNPTARAERVTDILGTEQLPEGYHPVIGFGIPLVGDVVVLAGNEPDANGRLEQFGDHGFAYVKLTGFLGRAKREELRKWVTGRGREPDIRIQNQFHINADAVLKRGEMEIEGGTLLYTVYRGTLEESSAAGLANAMVLDCPDGSGGFGVWFARDPSEGQDRGDDALAGTPGDESEVREFLGHFDLCLQ